MVVAAAVVGGSTVDGVMVIEPVGCGSGDRWWRNRSVFLFFRVLCGVCSCFDSGRIGSGGASPVGLAPGGSVDLAEQSAELLDRVLCDGHEIVGGLRPCECEHV